MPASKASQAFVPVREVRNGIIILKDGGYRGVLMCSSVNFSLKSEDEQRSIIGGFQSFLNTLDFSTQIMVHSRKMDIKPYLALLEERVSLQNSELMRIQVREYIQFIKSFIEGSDIMTKTFYVVVPYAPGAASGLGTSLPNKNRQAANAVSDDAFAEHRVQLEQRMSLAASGLASSGVRAVPLGTEEIIELLYRSFNPGETDAPLSLIQQ
jgi:hypothetical protein